MKLPDPLIMLLVIMMAAWAGLIGIFDLAFLYLVPLGGARSHQPLFLFITFHALKSLGFIALVAAMLYAWLWATRFVRNRYLSLNESSDHGNGIRKG
ncbi:MAG: hypothetical protein M1357_02220 [Candidatus Marsarchaeota archaeon]|nr:hypothetical protein [Candidatus Marsarchaeota archaeon]